MIFGFYLFINNIVKKVTSLSFLSVVKLLDKTKIQYIFLQKKKRFNIFHFPCLTNKPSTNEKHKTLSTTQKKKQTRKHAKKHKTNLVHTKNIKHAKKRERRI